MVQTTRRIGRRIMTPLRRGMAIVIVLALISMTVAVSYALIRTQFTSLAIEENAGRSQQARDAAWAGVGHALKQLHSSSWAGTGTSETKSLGNRVSFSVSYTAGDASLAAGSPEYPYRVTVDVTGRVASSVTGVPDTTFQYRLVLQLVPRQLSAEPDGWQGMSSRTLTQWDGASDLLLEVPARIEGTAAVQGQLQFFQSYPTGNDAMANYGYDLGIMANVGRGDFRPFGGPVLVGPQSRRGIGIVLLRNVMGVSTQDISELDTPAFRATNVPTTYQLYRGGPTYTVPTLGATLEGVRLEPDPKLNPLGIYRLSHRLTLGNNVSFDGILLSDGDSVRLQGTGIEVRAVELPALADSGEVYSMPAIATRGEIVVESGASASCDGFVLAERRFVVKPGSSGTALALRGSLATAELKIGERVEWPTASSWWNDALSSFEASKVGLADPVYFPEFVRDEYGFDPRPQITIKSPTGNTRYHWQDWTQPVFVPHPDDDGLRWSIVQWQADPGSS